MNRPCLSCISAILLVFTIMTPVSSSIAAEGNGVETKLRKLNKYAAEAWEQSKERLLSPALDP